MKKKTIVFLEKYGKKTTRQNIKGLLLIALLVFFAGFVFGEGFKGSVGQFAKKKEVDTGSSAIRLGMRKYTNPLLLVNLPENSTAFKDLLPLKTTLEKYTDEAKRSGDIKDVSVYFQDLNSGKWTGVNQDDMYSPASLLKVPIMMAYYKLAEKDPSVLGTRFQYQGDGDKSIVQMVKPQEYLIAGHSYSVDDLIYRMVVYSDNDARIVLLNHVDQKIIFQLFSDLKIPMPQNLTDASNFLSARMYSRFFRVLFNASYLDDTSSEKAFDLLVQSDFSSGLVASLPPDIKVAHKFGEREYVNAQGGVVSNELHDCGIVYYPLHPYLLCVMTKGENFDELTKVLRNVSAETYTYVKKEYE